MRKKKPLVDLIILDRDGVINYDSKEYIKSADEWKPILSSIEAITELKRKNIPVAIATNQSGINRGFYSISTLKEIHEKLLNYLSNDRDTIKYIAYCPHRPDENCFCRKPRSGMLYEISYKLRIKLTQKVFLVGDKIQDIQAGESVGCTPVLVRTGNGLETISYNKDRLRNIKIFDNLKQFVELAL